MPAGTGTNTVGGILYNEVDGGMVFHKSAGQSERDVVGVLVFVQVLFAVMPYGPGVGATVSAYQVKNSPFEPVVYKLYGFVFGAKKRLFPFFQYHRYQVVAVQIESPVIVETPLIQFFKVLQMGGGVELVPAQEAPCSFSLEGACHQKTVGLLGCDWGPQCKKA